jgi:hypothetical protein
MHYNNQVIAICEYEVCIFCFKNIFFHKLILKIITLVAVAKKYIRGAQVLEMS